MKRLNKQVAFCPHCGKSASEPNAPHQLACGTILNGKYLVGRAIGEGGFGITYVGLDLNLELKIAIKEFFPNGFATRSSSVSNTVTINNSQGGYFNDSKNLFLREAKSLAKFSSEKGIVDVRDYFTENNTTYIVMEYMEGGTLSARLKNKGVPCRFFSNTATPPLNSTASRETRAPGQTSIRSAPPSINASRE